MSEDGKSFVERRLSPRIKMTVRRHIAYWVAMSPARRVVFSLGLAAVIGGATFGACRASDLTGPNFKSQQHANGSVSRSLGSIINDEDSDTWPMVPATKEELDDDQAKADPDFEQTTEVQSPITEVVFNTCTGEGPIVLNGNQKTRTRLKVDPLNSIEFRLKQFRDTRGVYGEFKYNEDYWDDDSQSWKKRERVVRYRNRGTLLDRFEAGPLGLPFRSEFESVMFLQREEHWHEGHRDGDHHHEWRPGDDLFVRLRTKEKIDKNGNIRTEQEFRTECK